MTISWKTTMVKARTKRTVATMARVLVAFTESPRMQHVFPGARPINMTRAASGMTPACSKTQRMVMDLSSMCTNGPIGFADRVQLRVDRLMGPVAMDDSSNNG